MSRSLNFRALRSLSLDFSSTTVMIGENDCGKTSVMLAIEVFFEGKKLNDRSDFFKKQTGAPVVINVVFHELEGNYEEYLPLDSMVEVINELYRTELAECGRDEVEDISTFDVDTSKPIENQMRHLVHKRYAGVRFEYLKVRLGEEAVKRMLQRGLKPNDEIINILKRA